MNYLAIVQARLNSERLEKKVIKKIYKNLDVLDTIINKLKKIREIDKIVIATGSKNHNMDLNKKKKHCNIFFGSDSDVKSRYIFLIKKYKPKYVIRVTADNPLLDTSLIKILIKYSKKNKKFKYLKFLDSHINYGSGCELFESNYFLKYQKNSNFSKEHVTPDLFNKKYSKKLKLNSKDFIPVKVTIDDYNDLSFVRYLYKNIDHPNNNKINIYFKKMIAKYSY